MQQALESTLVHNAKEMEMVQGKTASTASLSIPNEAFLTFQRIHIYLRALEYSMFQKDRQTNRNGSTENSQ